jgi:hypothetical protein
MDFLKFVTLPAICGGIIASIDDLLKGEKPWWTSGMRGFIAATAGGLFLFLVWTVFGVGG